MALALADAANLKPEIGLAQALQDYETVLTDEEKVVFHAQGVPNADEVIKLTTLIDRKREDGRLHCMGPRLITFLESVQQFSKVVETLVSSNPAIAALVWGGVKLALLIANNISSYFDQLSVLFMDLGKQCPRFREFESLYPSSKGLQKALCDYYAGVVRLCRHSTKVYRTPTYKWLPKAIWSPFESEFGPLKAELQRLADEVQQEISLAAAKSHQQEYGLQQKERRSASHGRKMLKDISRTVRGLDEAADSRELELSHRRLEKLRRKALDTLSVYDHLKTYKQLRKECVPGTSTWLCDAFEFRDWLQGSGKTLWCTGKLGSGKSVLSACVAAYLSSNASTKDVVSFFFCRHDHQESLKARTIIGTIARQLVAGSPAKAFEGVSFANPDLEAITEYLQLALAEKQQYFIILDGLDECEEIQIRRTAQALQSLLELPRLHIKVYFSSRPYVVQWLPLGLRPEQHIVLESRENQERVASDIGTLIENTLVEQLRGESPELHLGDPNIILTIRNTLRERAQGMFLWVKFQLSDLCDHKSDCQILAALEDLPADLPQTFGRLLRKYVKSHDISLGSQIFRWTAVAKRPLTLAELREAIAIGPLQEDWRGENMINDMKKAIACCGNLIFVDEEDQTVHFTHSSVKQYLISNNLDDSLQPYKIILENADSEAGITCVTYLNFNVFNTQVAPGAAPRADISGLPVTVFAKALPLRESSNKLALRLLKHTGKSRQSVPVLIEPKSAESDPQGRRVPADIFAFRQYAKQYWLFHTKGCREATPQFKQLWKNLIEEASWRDTLSSVSWTSEDWTEGNTYVMEWIIEEDHSSLASLLFEALPMSLSHANQILEGAARTGYTSLVDLVLLSDFAGNSSVLAIQSAFKSAAGLGNIDVIERLLPFISRKKSSRYPGSGKLKLKLEPIFSAAAEGGHVAIIDRLLKAKLDDEHNLIWRAPQLALVKAASFGHLAVVERLLREDLGLDPLVAGLSEAAAEGHLEVVDRLLRETGEVPATQRHSPLFDPLVRAAIGGHSAVTRRLLREQTSLNHEVWGTALQQAASKGHSAVVIELVKMSALIDRPTSQAHYLENALRMAASKGQLAVVEQLLMSGVDVDSAPDERHWWITSLHVATVNGQAAVVECLLRHRAKVSTVGFKRRGEASALLHESVVEQLRAAGAV